MNICTLSRAVLVCLFLPAFCLAACSGEKGPGAYLDEAAGLYRQEPEDAAAIVAVFTRGLEAHPDNIPLLQSRAGFLCSHGMLPQCRADVDRLIQLKPELIEVRMMRCMLDEFEKADPEQYDACYRDIVGRIAALPPPADDEAPEHKLARKFNYVFALLMAGHPDAQTELEDLLEQARALQQEEFYIDLLRNFDRQRVLKDIFGQKSE
ncbi:hypothetical protein LJC59_09475 [Desulfovibrio sp. OttesenSCG-928-A18]|nr:hypothetical protein [Desulfovibrio sp. OttesenSCG-928-A18]